MIVVWMTLWQNGLPQLQWGVALGASLVAAVLDVASRRIPNILTGPVLLGGLVWAFRQAGWAGLGDSVLAGVMLATPYVFLFVFAGGGAGDAKLMAAIGAWLGVVNGLAVLVCVAICGLALAVAMALIKKQMTHLLSSLAGMVVDMVLWLTAHSRQRPQLQAASSVKVTIPYGLAIFTGLVIAAAGVYLWRF